jgi:hypothetical protein
MRCYGTYGIDGFSTGDGRYSSYGLTVVPPYAWVLAQETTGSFNDRLRGTIDSQVGVSAVGRFVMMHKDVAFAVHKPREISDFEVCRLRSLHSGGFASFFLRGFIGSGSCITLNHRNGWLSRGGRSQVRTGDTYSRNLRCLYRCFICAHQDNQWKSAKTTRYRTTHRVNRQSREKDREQDYDIRLWQCARKSRNYGRQY